MAAKKQYGLIIPQAKAKNALLNKPSVFGDDSSDEDEESQRKKVNMSIRKEGIKRLEAKNTRNMLTDALSEDPTVFDYDKIYDKLQEKKKETDLKLKAKKDTSSKYIARLKRTAEERKIEQEMAYERKVQKEQEVEGHLYADKDAFVTPSYLKKLEERAEMERKLKLEEEIEKINDVTKQNDLSRFYRNMLERKTTTKVDTRDTITPVKNSSAHLEREKDQSIGSIRSGDSTEGRNSTADSEPVVKINDDVRDEDKPVDTISTEPCTPTEDNNLQPNTVKPDDSTPQSVHVESVESDGVEETVTVVKETAEERRRRLFAKRTNEEQAMSAKERYLARKKAKLSEPVISTDDD